MTSVDAEEQAGDASASWVPKESVVIRLLASGAMDLYLQGESGRPFRLPYPASLQNALDKLTLLCWHRGAEPPTSVVDMLGWAARPFNEWPVKFPHAAIDLDEVLIAGGRPTISCEELALRGDVEGEIRENELMRAVFDTCRAADSQESYVAFRALLIEHPAITEMELDIQLSQPELARLAEQIREAYLPVPVEAIDREKVRTCGGCHGIRVPGDDPDSWRCADGSCPDPTKLGPEWPSAEGVRWLRRELRTFVVAPGRAELRIANKLRTAGAKVDLWPEFDTYDLAVFERQTWVVDVKAWRSPERLGSKLRHRIFTPPEDAQRAFIVVAREQAKAQHRYIDRLRRSCPSLRRGGAITPIAEDDFVRLVRREMGDRE